MRDPEIQPTRSSERHRGLLNKYTAATAITLGVLGGMAVDKASEQHLAPAQSESSRSADAAQARQAVEASPTADTETLTQPEGLSGLEGRTFHDEVLVLDTDKVNVRDYPGTHTADGQDSDVLDIDGQLTVFGTVGGYSTDANGEWRAIVIKHGDNLRVAFFNMGAAAAEQAVEQVTSEQGAIITNIQVHEGGVLAQLEDDRTVGLTTAAHS